METSLFVASISWAASASQPTLVELFTSQGCSSCPPADAFLGELAKRARANGCRCVGLAGRVEDRPALAEVLDDCRALTDLTTAAEAEADAARWLEKLACEAALGFTGIAPA